MPGVVSHEAFAFIDYAFRFIFMKRVSRERWREHESVRFVVLMTDAAIKLLRVDAFG